MRTRGCRRNGPPELINAILKEEVPRASTVASAPIWRRRALEGDLNTILGKALKKDPAERYASVGAFAEDLPAIHLA